jgi:hypothetical protein
MGTFSNMHTQKNLLIKHLKNIKSGFQHKNRMSLIEERLDVFQIFKNNLEPVFIGHCFLHFNFFGISMATMISRLYNHSVIFCPQKMKNPQHLQNSMNTLWK